MNGAPSVTSPAARGGAGEHPRVWFLVIFLSMYTTILERTREIGILKSLGASNADIIGLVLRESLLLCAVGVVIGICDTGVDRNVMPSLIDGWSPDPAGAPYGMDTGGHGTMTSTDAVGMAIDAKIADIGVLKAPDAQSAISYALAGFQWALDKFRGPLKYPHILSNSWGVFQKSWAPDYATDPNHPFTRKVREVIDACCA